MPINIKHGENYFRIFKDTSHCSRNTDDKNQFKKTNDGCLRIYMSLSNEHYSNYYRKNVIIFNFPMQKKVPHNNDESLSMRFLQ